MDKNQRNRTCNLWPFKKKFTENQIDEIDDAAEHLNKLISEMNTGIDNFFSSVSDLYSAANDLLEENPRSLIDLLNGIQPVDPMSVIPDAHLLVTRARNGMKEFAETMIDIESRIASLEPKDWYPNYFRKIYGSFDAQFKAVVQLKESVYDALEPESPLKIVLGNHRLNVFHSSISLYRLGFGN